jgi:hypothetical protein
MGVLLYTDSGFRWDFDFYFSLRFFVSWWTETNPGRINDRSSSSPYSGWIKFLGLGVHPPSEKSKSCLPISLLIHFPLELVPQHTPDKEIAIFAYTRSSLFEVRPKDPLVSV